MFRKKQDDLDMEARIDSLSNWRKEWGYEREEVRKEAMKVSEMRKQKSKLEEDMKKENDFLKRDKILEKIERIEDEESEITKKMMDNGCFELFLDIFNGITNNSPKNNNSDNNTHYGATSSTLYRDSTQLLNNTKWPTVPGSNIKPFSL